MGVLHAAYELGTGLGFSVDGGYLAELTTSSDRPATVSPRSRPTNNGTATDKLRLSGLTLGGSAFFHRGESWPLTLRLGVGVLLGAVHDARSGTFTNSLGASYTANVAESDAATYLYAAPEVRIGRRFGDHFELSFGVEAIVLAALSPPRWADTNQVLTTPDPATSQGDGLGGFGAQTLAGSIVVIFAPGLGARYEF
jgi:hypothetical protein